MDTSHIPFETKSKIAEEMKGYVDGHSTTAEELGLNSEEVDSILEEIGVESCPTCGSYVDC